MIEAPDTMSIDYFCSLFGLTTYEDLCSLNLGWIYERSADIASCFEEDSDEWNAAFDAESKRTWENINSAHEKAMKAATDYLSNECMISVILDENTAMVTFGSEDWNKAMDIVIESINGYGMFKFDSGEELILSGPYANAKAATIAHMHWHKERGDIFGETGIKELFQKTLEQNNI